MSISRGILRSVVRSLGVGMLALTALTFLSGVYAQGPTIIFLHHSCGANLIAEGQVREGLTSRGYEFYDHGYNEEGLVLADGTWTGTNFDVPGDNTDPDGYAAIFAQPLQDPPGNTFSHLMQYDVIAFKSCFPVSNIDSDEQLDEYRSYYLSIRDRMDQYPDKLFVIVTQPPEVPANSSPDAAARARAFVNWLQSEEYLAGRSNIVVFDFFGLLAGGDNFLRPEYRMDEYDAHPNELANSTIGPLFVDFLDEAIRSHGGGAPRPPAQATPISEPVGMPSPTHQVFLPVAAADTTLIDDFEAYSPGEGWETWTDGGQTTIECLADSGSAVSGKTSLRVEYSVTADGWAGCGRSYDRPQDWSATQGLAMWVRGSDQGQVMAVTLHVGDPQDPTPFQTELTPPSGAEEEWTLVQIPWSEFAKPEWFGEGGVQRFDPAAVVSLSFDFSGQGTSRREGKLWVDDLTLTVGSQVAEITPVVQGQEPPQQSGGFSPCSGLALPLAGLGFIVWRRRRPLWAMGR